MLHAVAKRLLVFSSMCYREQEVVSCAEGHTYGAIKARWALLFICESVCEITVNLNQIQQHLKMFSKWTTTVYATYCIPFSTNISSMSDSIYHAMINILKIMFLVLFLHCQLFIHPDLALKKRQLVVQKLNSWSLRKCTQLNPHCLLGLYNADFDKFCRSYVFFIHTVNVHDSCFL